MDNREQVIPLSEDPRMDRLAEILRGQSDDRQEAFWDALRAEQAFDDYKEGTETHE